MSQTDDLEIFAQLEQASATHVVNGLDCSPNDFCESSFDLGDRQCPSEANNSMVLNEKSVSFINLKELAVEETSKCIDPKLLQHAFQRHDAASETPTSATAATWMMRSYRGPPLPPVKKQKRASSRPSLASKVSLFSDDAMPCALQGSLSPPSSSSCYPNEKENAMDLMPPPHMSVHLVQKPIEMQRKRAPLACVSQSKHATRNGARRGEARRGGERASQLMIVFHSNTCSFPL